MSIHTNFASTLMYYVDRWIGMYYQMKL